MVNFHMEKLTMSIKDKKDKNEIIRLTVGELQSTLAQRPGAQAIKSVVQLPFCYLGWAGAVRLLMGVESVTKLFKSPIHSLLCLIDGVPCSQLYIATRQPKALSHF